MNVFAFLAMFLSVLSLPVTEVKEVYKLWFPYQLNKWSKWRMMERGVALSAFISFQRPLPIGSLRGQDWPNKRKIGSHILQVGTLPA